MADAVSLRSTYAVTVSGDRTNVALQSEDQTTTWSVNGGTRSRTAVSPYGTVTATILTEDGSVGAAHNLLQSNAGFVSAGVLTTYSAWVKRGAGSRHASLLVLGSGGTDFYRQGYDLGLGVTGTTSITGSATVLAKGVERWSDGWLRLYVTGVITPQPVTQVRVEMATDTANTVVYNGDGVSQIYVWGTQLETANAPSSYIRTTTASATGPGSRSRLIGYYAVGGAAASSLQLKNGSAAGSAYVNVDIPAGAGIGTPAYVANQGGVVFPDGIYLDITGTPTGVTVIYEK